VLRWYDTAWSDYPGWRWKPQSTGRTQALGFGSGVGIEIHGNELEVVAARVRASRVRVLGRLTIENFTERPAAEWGAEYTRFLKLSGVGHLSARCCCRAAR